MTAEYGLCLSSMGACAVLCAGVAPVTARFGGILLLIIGAMLYGVTRP